MAAPTHRQCAASCKTNLAVKQNGPRPGRGAAQIFKPKFKDVAKIDKLRTFLLSFGDTLNISALERHLGLGTRTLRAWMQGLRSINPASRNAVEAWAKKYGYRQ